ncbi:MAG: hypothetical protein P4L73_03520 [Caulobacteraceae bacterium]|nr:hypothetical protein [Caulobacteraceae bacterium]
MAESDRLPTASLERHVAILGTSDAGKTYAAKGEIEQLLGSGRRVCIIDPTGVWYGLRLAPDGVTPSPFKVAIFGGDHGDVALPPEAGARVAELVAGGAFSSIVDVSRMTVGARTRLFAEFAERLAQVNRAPLHLVIDEAHLFAPQGRVHDPMSGRMLHAANNLVSGGRALGIRVMMLSQRPAKLHKDSLTQVQTLVAMFCTAPHDREAIKAWIKDAADPVVGREIEASLPSLQVGEAWVWAPRLDVLRKIKFGRITTYDSSATPDASAGRKPVSLAALDLALLEAALLAPEEGEPSVSASAKGAAKHSPSPKQLQEAVDAAEASGRARGMAEGYARGLEDGERKEWRRWMDRQHAEHMAKAEAILSELAAEQIAAERKGHAAGAPRPVDAASSLPALAHAVRRPPSRRETHSKEGSPPLSAGALKIIGAASIDPGVRLSDAELAILAGLHPTAGYTRAAFRQINARVAEGRELPMAPAPFTDAAALVDHFAGKVGGAGARILRHLYVMGPQPMDRACAEIGLSPNAGYTRAGWKALRSGQLIEQTERGWQVCAAILKLKGQRP